LAVVSFREELEIMVKRRSLMVGGLVTAAASSLTRVALGDSGKPMLVFVGHEQ
jgi:hypothetical protein